MSGLGWRALRLLRKPPGYVARRLAAEVQRELDRFTQPWRARRMDAEALCASSGAASLAQLWERLALQPWPLASGPIDAGTLATLNPAAAPLILRRAAQAARHELELLGSGPVALGGRIDWDVDFKSGARWEPRYFRDIPTLNAQRPSDIKIPWELSRLQWLIPLGQAYRLTGEARFAGAAREVLEQWLRANPTGRTVNWAIAMEPALRLMVLIWLFRVFAPLKEWSEPDFRERLLCSLYQHAQFVARYIEHADVNGNHYTADCAALVVAGTFFGGAEARGWLERGHAELEREITRQILADGVDFEVSTAYHRLVAELFLLAAIHARHAGVAVSGTYRERLRAAARFTAAYTRPDGSAPLWGDADDARALPLGTGAVTDHRHLVAATAVFLDDPELAALAGGGWDEVYWLFGHAAPPTPAPALAALSAFPAGGAYVLRSQGGHVFIDCGEVGLAGRGGHGHNDALAFEAMLGGVPVVSDAGCLVYTGSFEERNLFRSTAVHSTPQVDGEEINRFVSAQLLWVLRDDARPVEPRVAREGEWLVFEGGHSGYTRLPSPVTPWRRLELHAGGRQLRITDTFRGTGVHALSIPLQLAPGWELLELGDLRAQLRHERGSRLVVSWQGSGGWQTSAASARVAPSYGVAQAAVRLVSCARGSATQLRLQTDIEITPGS